MSLNVRHVHRPKYSNLKHVSLSPFYTVLVAILFNTFSFNQSAKGISFCNIFSIIALFLFVYVTFHTKNGEGWSTIKLSINIFKCSLDYLYICQSLKIACLINQTKVATTFKIVLAALYLIKCFGTQALLTKFH